MKQLREVNRSGTRVTEAGMAELRKALPQCRVYGMASLRGDAPLAGFLPMES